MKLYIFSPNKNSLFTAELETLLLNKFDVTFYTEPQPLEKCLEAIEDDSEKVIALDPDFFDWSFKKEDLNMLKNVKAICLQTTSFSWIDSEYAKSIGIPVINLRGFSQEAVAEYALFLALGVARKLPLLAQDDYKQDFLRHQGIELRGKTAGIVGLGRIGKSIASLCKGIGMGVTYWSLNSRDESYTYSDLENLFETSDVIFITLANNSSTTEIMTAELFLKMKKGGIFINTSHKYNHDLLVKLVQDKAIYGYGYEEDNASPTNHTGNILSLPSVAWATKESMGLNAKIWTDSILKAAEGIFTNQVN